MKQIVFALPCILICIGLYLLVKANDVPAINNPKPSQQLNSTSAEITMNIEVKGRGIVDSTIITCCGAVAQKEAETEIGETESQTSPDNAYKYFILGSIILIVLLILPRLKELTISKDSISFELIEEIEKQVQAVQVLVKPSEGQGFIIQQADSSNIQERLSDINRKIGIIKLMASRKNDK